MEVLGADSPLIEGIGSRDLFEEEPDIAETLPNEENPIHPANEAVTNSSKKRSKFLTIAVFDTMTS